MSGRATKSKFVFEKIKATKSKSYFPKRVFSKQVHFCGMKIQFGALIEILLKSLMAGTLLRRTWR